MYLDRVVSILDCYHERFGDDFEFEYRASKRFRRVELRLIVQEEKFNPLEKERPWRTIGSSSKFIREEGEYGQARYKSHQRQREG